MNKAADLRMGPEPPRRFALLLEFDGTGLVGWQRQAEGVSIQGAVEEAARRLFTLERAYATTSGRTDAGVHACAMTIHIDLPTSKTISPQALRNGLNHHLKPLPCAVLEAVPVPPSWNARFSALWRRYCYVILNRPARGGLFKHRAWHHPKHLDVDALNDMARQLIGTHDFTSFRASACQARSPTRHLESFEFRRQGDYVIALIKARAFLHHQIRNMIGTLARNAGRADGPEHIKAVLAAKNRAAAGITAPAEGLYFIETGYSERIFADPGRLPFGFADFA